MKTCLHISGEIAQFSPFRKPRVKLTVMSGDVTSLIWPSLWHHFQEWPLQESKLFSSVWSWKANPRGSTLSAHRQYHYCLCIMYAVAPFTFHVRTYFLILNKGIWGLAYPFSNITIFIWKNHKVGIYICLEKSFQGLRSFWTEEKLISITGILSSLNKLSSSQYQYSFKKRYLDIFNLNIWTAFSLCHIKSLRVTGSVAEEFFVQLLNPLVLFPLLWAYCAH